MRILNRVDELTQLQARLTSNQAELLVVYGRRRIGKTELLSHLATSSKALYIEATDTVRAEQLRDVSAELARSSGNRLLTDQPLTSWDAVFTAIAQFVGADRTLVVFDEFQYLATRSSELETTLSRWWRTTGRLLPLTLVLAGSELSFFEDRVLAGQLYGRRTGQLKLEPFLAWDAALFHPGYSADDRVRAYSICGGIPYYLERFSDNRPLTEHLISEVFERTGLLHEEAELMLRQSIPDPSHHSAVLRSIAYGQNRHNEIAQRTELPAPQVARILEALERLGLVEKLRPITTSPRGKKTAYAISDQFLRFHYRFVEPAKSQLRSSELAATYVRQNVLPHLDHHASLAWEEMCRQYVLHTADDVSEVGRWWGQVPTGIDRRTEEREIDVVGVDGNRTPIVLGMCKWTNQEVDFDELNLLDRLAQHVKGHTGEEKRYLFSRNGFSERLRAYAANDQRCRLITPEDIYTDLI
ncbi:ATP-binding protein [Phytoactinopolyspora endophytica]|uniref:ATP-binding protein n=1 Tax=Phytoactinopolyspora endophytica TaxID=1642495 RepID=UPI00101D9900|nr:ATP-binding protein [Phytoactinopolyspora endophytica]